MEVEILHYIMLLMAAAMPIRGLIYLTDNYKSYITLNNLDIYSPVLQNLPLPQYFVFYNGTEDAPDQATLKLTDAFPKIKGKEPCLECTATLLNINYGHNEQLMNKCKKLREYAYLIHHIRQNISRGMDLNTAADEAVEHCIRNHILEKFLLKHQGEVKHMVLYTFDQENHDRIIKEAYTKRGIAIGKEEGIAIGKEEGIAIEEQKLLFRQIRQKLNRDKSLIQIADELEEDLDVIEQIVAGFPTQPMANS